MGLRHGRRARILGIPRVVEVTDDDRGSSFLGRALQTGPPMTEPVMTILFPDES
jgi:hypothetical protein